MKIRIPWSNPSIGNQEKKNVLHCFKVNRFTQSAKVEKFEKKISKFVGAKYAVAVSNGTVALDLAYKAINLKKNDEVIVPSISYISTATAVSYQGAIPVFVDVDINTGCIDPSKIEKAITKKTKAISFIDYGGIPADYKKIKIISKKYRIPIVLDAAQSLGAKQYELPLGSGGLISTMSFHMAKIITTVEGGAVFTNKKKIYDKLKILRNIGEPKNKKYQHVLLGTNARMTDIQASFGLSQMNKINQILKARERVANTYDLMFKNNTLITKLTSNKPNDTVSNFFYPILINNRNKVAKQLLEKYGIDTRICYPRPIYEQPIYKKNILNYKKFPSLNAEIISKKVLNLPIYPDLKKNEILYIVKSLNKLLRL
jgi:perosamine synthetase